MTKVCPFPQNKLFESQTIELGGEPLIQYQTCFMQACFEGEGSEIFFNDEGLPLSPKQAL
ncbi:hypothetical protein FF011L_24170 [Roseimaritima multifibrata]|uniref:Uncharacterized protein n=1 Tax=Roseimaritima multifibrata TaxID=1930274 RepID=A0A517MFI2_9BACT|nr:hypothetical protein FF011L_24170 [Roseimaritima multifibrata]